jgi:integrase
MKVTISNNNGYIRIRVSIEDNKRLIWHPGLKYTDINLKAAKQLVSRIEIDILANCFDPSFKKYSLTPKVAIAVKEPSIHDYWLEWADFHRDKLSPTSYLSELNTVTKLLKRYPKLPLKDYSVLVKKAPTHYAKRTCANCWKWLRTCFNWHIANGNLKDNPFNPLPRGFKSLPKKSDIGIFSTSQKETIIKEFEKKASYYVPFIKFLFFTGCRPEEAIALTWNDIKPDYIIIDKAFTRGILKETKTKKDRKIPLNNTIRDFLSKHYFASFDLNKPHSQVFPAPYTTYINLSNFGTNKWKPIIEKLVYENKLPEYLSLYHCRHTFISECLNAKIPIQQIAKWVGNSPEMIWRHYAGVMDDYSLPE